MSTTRRDTIQISLGPSSNSITSHLLNLQGLAGTKGNNNNNYNDYCCCDIQTTHSNTKSSYWVPRVLLIDESTRLVSSYSQQQQQQQQIAAANNNDLTSLVSTWNGPIEQMDPSAGLSLTSNFATSTNISSTTQSSDWNIQQYHQQDQSSSSSFLNTIWDTSNTLAYSSHSRYYCPQQQQQQQQSQWYNSSSATTTTAAAAGSRHVNWDDIGEEEDEDDEEENEYTRKQREQQDQYQWYTQTQIPLQNQLSTMWQDQYQYQQQQNSSSIIKNNDTTPPINRSSNNDTTTTTTHNNSNNNNNSSYNMLSKLNWIDYFQLSPYGDKNQSPLVSIPYNTTNNIITDWDCYSYSINKEWLYDELFDNKLRHILEQCDYGCQGFTITTENYGFYSNLTNKILNEFINDECKSSGRFIIHVTNDDDDDDINTQQEEQQESNNNTNDENQNPSSTISSLSNTNNNNNNNNTSSSSSSWHTMNVNRVRKHIQTGLLYNDFSENANLIMPLYLNTSNNNTNLFESSAQIAMALETATLPYRLQSSSSSSNEQQEERYSIGLYNTPFIGQSSSSNSIETQWGTMLKRISFQDFLSCHQPSSQYKFIELDTISQQRQQQNSSNLSLWEQFQIGTSIERDQRIRDEGYDAIVYRQRDINPGTWLQDSKHGGILSTHSSSISSSSSSNSNSNNNLSLNRSLHHHFALSTAIRYNQSTLIGRNSTKYDSQGHGTNMMRNTLLNDFQTCLIEGMGIKYRPERSMATIINQSISQLTYGGYGVGAYWESLLLPKLTTTTTTTKTSSNKQQQQQIQQQQQQQHPTIGVVLGNTTRIYNTQLYPITFNMNTILSSCNNTGSTGNSRLTSKQRMNCMKYRGFYNRDVMNGFLPEYEDCQDAINNLYNLRDLYQPSDGSGLVIDDTTNEDII